MKILNVQGLCKKYDNFYLDNVSFQLDRGFIMGFIGSNGAGKTTTLKGIMNIIHRDGGHVEILGKPFDQRELSMKQNVGFMLGGIEFYLKRKIKTVTKTVRRFYSQWDEASYQKYLKRFGLDPEKKIGELSQGMRVKYSLTLALSHGADLLILDEPTSGLDPVARDSLLELFQELVEDGQKSILFSTHITTDLEKCADYITYIKDGRIISSLTKEEFIASYRLVKGSKEELEQIKDSLVAHKVNSFGYLGLMETEKTQGLPRLNFEEPTLEDIMIYHAKQENRNG